MGSFGHIKVHVYWLTMERAIYFAQARVRSRTIAQD
jgi:hypothetical protein